MSASDASGRDRDEPIDVEWEPAGDRRRLETAGGVTVRTATIMSVAAALAGGVLGAVGSTPPVLHTNASATAAAATPDAETLARLAAVEARWASLETAVAGDDAQAIASRLYEVQRTLDALGGRLGGADLGALAAQIVALQNETAAIRADTATAATAARAAYAIAAATEAAGGSEPFLPALAVLQASLPANEDVAALAGYAATGAPSRLALLDAFGALEKDLLIAGRVSAAGNGLWARFIGFLAQHVTIRRVGAGDTAVDLVERAAARVRAGDLAGATAELDRLSGATADVAAPWVSGARARLDIDARLARIRLELAKGPTS